MGPLISGDLIISMNGVRYSIGSTVDQSAVRVIVMHTNRGQMVVQETIRPGILRDVLS